MPLTSGRNGAQPPGSGSAPQPPRGSRFSRQNLTCGGIGCGALLLFAALFFIGLAYPLIILALGALLVAGFGGALLIWKE